jgi:hypothetical protein
VAIIGARAIGLTKPGVNDHTAATVIWHLVVLSVRPKPQRRGPRIQLVEPVLERADRQLVHCRLETSEPANVAYNRRFRLAMLEPPLEVLRGVPPRIRMHERVASKAAR